MRWYFFFLLPLAAAAACASGSTGNSAVTPPQTVRVGTAGGAVELRGTTPEQYSLTAMIRQPAAQVWSALPGVYSSLGIPVNAVDSASHTLGNTGFRAHVDLKGVLLSRYFDCGRAQGEPSADTYELNVAIATKVDATREIGVSRLITRIEVAARPLTFSGGYNRCTSTGTLEQKIVDKLQPKS